MRMSPLPLLLAFLPVAAIADDCQNTVKAAYDKLATAPAVRQKVVMPGTPTLQMIMLGDTLYMDQGAGQWTKLPLDPGMRTQMMQETIPDASVLAECREVGNESLEGADMTVYEYVPPSIAGETPSPQQVWIGAADGLPHRMVTKQEGQAMEMTISYEDVTAPVQ